jgi:hypothetical protein
MPSRRGRTLGRLTSSHRPSPSKAPRPRPRHSHIDRTIPQTNMCILPYNGWQHSFAVEREGANEDDSASRGVAGARRSRMRTTTRWPRAFSPPSSGSCSAVVYSKVRRRRRWLFLDGSKVGTTRIVGIRLGISFAGQTTSVFMRWTRRRETERRDVPASDFRGYQDKGSSEVAAPGALYADDFWRTQSKNPLRASAACGGRLRCR